LSCPERMASRICAMMLSETFSDLFAALNIVDSIVKAVCT
jgi:hypothetical protein